MNVKYAILPLVGCGIYIPKKWQKEFKNEYHIWIKEVLEIKAFQFINDWDEDLNDPCNYLCSRMGEYKGAFSALQTSSKYNNTEIESLKKRKFYFNEIIIHYFEDEDQEKIDKLNEDINKDICGRINSRNQKVVPDRFNKKFTPNKIKKIIPDNNDDNANITDVKSLAKLKFKKKNKIAELEKIKKSQRSVESLIEGLGKVFDNKQEELKNLVTEYRELTYSESIPIRGGNEKQNKNERRKLIKEKIKKIIN